MAKYELNLKADFNDFLNHIENWVIRSSASASLEDQSDYQVGDFRCAFRVIERYSLFGDNRLSMSIVLIGQGDELFLSGITAGGSKAVFLKINTIGEETFLDVLIDAVNAYGKT